MQILLLLDISNTLLIIIIKRLTISTIIEILGASAIKRVLTMT